MFQVAGKDFQVLDLKSKRSYPRILAPEYSKILNKTAVVDPINIPVNVPDIVQNAIVKNDIKISTYTS